MPRPSRNVALLLILTSLALPGCSRYPRPFVAPDIDPQQAADRAFELYDQNGDGSLSLEELQRCPGVLSAIGVYDGDGNGQISKEEMVRRIQAWQEGPAMMTLSCRVTMDGRPLTGAEVQCVPEDYLQEWLHTASGTSGANGVTSIAIAPEHLPSTHQRLRAVHAGVYKIKITHSSVTIPDQYNTMTTLGREVSKETGDSAVQELALRSK